MSQFRNDSDGDSVPNSIDKCPTDCSKAASGICGVPDKDSDEDVVADCYEECKVGKHKVMPDACCLV